MDDAHLVVAVAAETVRRYGERAVPRLRDHAEIATGLGDALSAEAWTDIAEAADLILRGSVAIYYGRRR